MSAYSDWKYGLIDDDEYRASYEPEEDHCRYCYHKDEYEDIDKLVEEQCHKCRWW